MATILEVENLGKSFGAVVVADKLSLSLAKGEALGIIGPNGAGKTSLFDMVAGVMKPTVGRVLLDGADITQMRADRRCRLGIGRCFQIPKPFLGLSVFENLLVAAAFGSRKREAEVAARCADILVETGLANRANQPAGGLALLQRKRLELARALATEPRVLLLDEIAGGLTEAECHSLVETIHSVRRRGVSIIWIEHVLHALTAVVERLLVLNFGKVIGVGKPDEIMNSREVREIYLGIEV